MFNLLPKVCAEIYDNGKYINDYKDSFNTNNQIVLNLHNISLNLARKLVEKLIPIIRKLVFEKDITHPNRKVYKKYFYFIIVTGTGRQNKLLDKFI